MDKHQKLAESLLKSKKVLNKVEGNRSTSTNLLQKQPIHTVQTQQINSDQLITAEQMIAMQQSGQQSKQQIVDGVRMSGLKNMENSKLPQSIKESFANNPGIDPTQPAGMELVHEVIQKQSINQQQDVHSTYQQTTPSPMYQQSAQEKNKSLDLDLIDHIIEKTVEIVLEKINSNSKSLDENIKITIGGKTFGGKISTLKEVKNETKK